MEIDPVHRDNPIHSPSGTTNDGHYKTKLLSSIFLWHGQTKGAFLTRNHRTHTRGASSRVMGVGEGGAVVVVVVVWPGLGGEGEEEERREEQRRRSSKTSKPGADRAAYSPHHLQSNHLLPA